MDTIPDVLEERVRRSGDATCVWFDDVGYTFRELYDRSTATANALGELGVGPGDAVALFLGSCIEFVDVWLACARIGAVSVPINTAYAGEFLAHQLHDSRTKLALCDRDTVERVRTVAPELAVLVQGESAEALLAGDRTALKATSNVVWNAPASILYTSGTTGPSKGVVVTQHYLVGAARIVSDAYALQPGDVTYGAVPLFHFSGMLGSVLAAIVAGSSAVVDRKFSVSATWERVRHYGATGVIAVGSMIVMLWNLPRSTDEPKLRFLAGAPIPAELHRAIEERYGCRIVTMYGLTEAFPIAVMGVDDPGRPGAAGRINPLFDVQILDDDDQPVAVDDVGEIACRPRSPHVMFEGYFANADATVERFRNLWFHTGDLGRFDEDGYLYFVDRKKDAMRRRGENISSFEVEQIVMKHPAVAECAAHGVPSEVGEDDVKICVIRGGEVTHEELLDYCKSALPFFAVPRYIEFVDDLPRNAVGRILKYELRNRGVTPATWEATA